jgi:hypothetical protein
MWPEMAYYRGTNTSVLSTTGYKAQSFCPESAQLLSEMSQSDYELFVNNMNATGATYQDIGMLWAARMMSSTGMFSSNVTATPTNGGSVTRHVIFMTDGAQQASNGIQQAYGIEWNDRRITDDGYSSDDARHLSRFRAICDAIKGRIRIWVIGYATSLTSDLTYCASPSSSFTANNDDQINSVSGNCQTGQRLAGVKLMRRALRHLGCDNRGATAIEYAFVLPILMLIVMGTGYFGQMLWPRPVEWRGASGRARCHTGRCQHDHP